MVAGPLLTAVIVPIRLLYLEGVVGDPVDAAVAAAPPRSV